MTAVWLPSNPCQCSSPGAAAASVIEAPSVDMPVASPRNGPRSVAVAGLPAARATGGGATAAGTTKAKGRDPLAPPGP